MAQVCFAYKLAPADFWALDAEELAALVELMEELHG